MLPDKFRELATQALRKWQNNLSLVCSPCAFCLDGRMECYLHGNEFFDSACDFCSCPSELCHSNGRGGLFEEITSPLDFPMNAIMASIDQKLRLQMLRALRAYARGE